MQGAHVSLGRRLLVPKVVVAEVGQPAASQARKMTLVQLETREYGRDLL